MANEANTIVQTKYDVVLYWKDGKAEKLTGWGVYPTQAVADAFNNAGYGHGALPALDRWEAHEV